jgi:transcriptional regulator with XRE-family HTH domain
LWKNKEFMKDLESMSDPGILRELGKSFRRMRLNQNRTQEEIARRSGLDRSTISQLENGRAASLLTIVQILRALNKLHLLGTFLSQPQISPLQLARLHGKQRLRASGDTHSPDKPESEW